MSQYGAIISPVDVRDYKLNVSKLTDEKFPDEFELSWIPKSRNQESVSSCVAHVASEIQEYFQKIQLNDTHRLAVGYIYGIRYDYLGEGMYLRDALKTMKDKGICTYQEFPWNLEVPEIIDKLNESISSEEINERESFSRRVSTYFRLNSPEDIKSALMKYGPVMISVKWYDNNDVKDGVLDKGSGSGGYHCLMVYGWNDKGFKFLNSWGSKWGDKGKCILPYDYEIAESWGITDTVVELLDDIKIPEDNFFVRIFYKIINFFCNLFKSFKGRD